MPEVVLTISQFVSQSTSCLYCCLYVHCLSVFLSACQSVSEPVGPRQSVCRIIYQCGILGLLVSFLIACEPAHFFGQKRENKEGEKRGGGGEEEGNSPFPSFISHRHSPPPKKK